MAASPESKVSIKMRSNSIHATNSNEDEHIFETSSNRKQTAGQKLFKLCKKRQNILVIFTIISVTVGFGLGFLLRQFNLSDVALACIGLPGKMVLRALSMCIIPLLASNIIVVMAKTNPKMHGLAGLFTLVYALSTNIVSTLTSAAFVLILKPGHTADVGNRSPVESHGLTGIDIFYDLLTNLIPRNLIEACFEQTVTKYYNVTKEIPKDNQTLEIVQTVRKQTNAAGTNIIGIVFASIIFGLAVSKTSSKCSGHFFLFFEHLSEMMLIIMNWIVNILPIAVISLLAESIASIEQLDAVMGSLGKFVTSVLLAVFTHQLVTLPLIYLIIVRKNPLLLYVKMYKAWITAFVSMSSAVSLPYMYEATDNGGMDRRISRFVLPLAMNCNGNGSAAFILSATSFMAAFGGVQLHVGQILLLTLLSGLAVIALPCVPSASIISVVILMGIVGAPSSFVSLLFTTEFILDRCRTTTNVISHIYCAGIIEKLCEKSLKTENKLEITEDDYEDNSTTVT